MSVCEALQMLQRYSIKSFAWHKVASRGSLRDLRSQSCPTCLESLKPKRIHFSQLIILMLFLSSALKKTKTTYSSFCLQYKVAQQNANYSPLMLHTKKHPTINFLMQLLNSVFGFDDHMSVGYFIFIIVFFVVTAP